MDIVVSHCGQDIEPLLKEFRAEAIIGTGVRKVNNYLEGRMTERFQRQYNMVN